MESLFQLLSNIFVEIQKLDILYKVIAFVLAAFVAWLVPTLFRCYKKGRILILNTQLKYVPSKAEINKLSFFQKVVLLPLGKPGLLLNSIVLLGAITVIGGLIAVLRPGFLLDIFSHYRLIQFLVAIYIVLVVSFILWLFSLKVIKKDLKGLVGLLSTELKEVKDSDNKDNDSIHFAYCSKLINGEVFEISYDERLPFQSEEEIRIEREQVILPYYTDLEERIKKDISPKYSKYFLVPFNGKDIHICKFLLDFAYSTKSLWKAVCDVDEKMHKEHLINFVGNKVGIWNYEISGGSLTLYTYHTDHFTFHVFKEIFHNEDYKDTFQLFIRRVNLVDYETRRYMVQCLKFLFSSFGIDITINTRNARGKEVMLIGLRNGAIERLGNDKLHVPVNESFSDTDLSDNEELSPLLCVRRGIIEELGLPDSIVNKATIKFHDFAIVSDEGEIGLSCNADFSSIILSEEMRCYPGQDKFLENKDLIEVPYPPFFWNALKYPYYFYKTTSQDILCTQWESFTPLLFQRIIVRNTSLGKIGKLFLNFFILAIFTAIVMLPYYDSDFNHQWEKYLATAVVTLCINVIIQLFIKALDRISKYEYSFLMPLVPQWNSDVKVYQCNDNIRRKKGGEGVEENFLANKLTFGISLCDWPNNKKRETDEFQISWNNIRLKEPPHCFVRREIIGHKESPISYYQIYEDTKRTDRNKLLLHIIPFYVRHGEITFNINIRFDKNNKKKVYYELSKKLPENETGSLVFKNMLNQNEIKSFSRYFGLEEDSLSLVKKSSLDKQFQNKYIPMDLMAYQGNYYWSLYELSPLLHSINENEINIINGKTDIYNDYIKNLAGDTSLWFRCKVEDAIDLLSKFISHPENRKRISTVDIYMLQLALIRKDIGCGKLLAIKKKPKWSIISSTYKKKYIHFETKMNRLLGFS